MPTASIADPGAIPGWKTVIPGKTAKFGEIEATSPPSEYIVHNGLHSSLAQQAWADYKAFLQEVVSTWNNDVRMKMNTYAQQKNGDPALQKLIDETRSDYNVASIKQGGGTFGQQAQSQQVTHGTSAKAAADELKTGGQGLLEGAKASGAQPEDSTVAAPIKDKVDKLNIARQQTEGSVDKLAGTTKLIDAAKNNLDAAKQIADEVSQKEIDKDKPSPELQQAQDIAKKINPTLGQLAATLVKYREPIGELKKAVASGAKAAEGDPKAALEAVMALLAIAKWDALQRQAEEMKLFAQASPQFKQAVSAADAVIGFTTQAKGFQTELEANIKNEKKAYEALAAELEKVGNWKGKDGAVAKRAADALRAIPVADRVLRVLREMRGALPRVPSASTRASQGFTLATNGVGAPGAEDLFRVGSWIAGAPQTISGEIVTWESLRAQLETVASALGVK